MLTLIHHGVCCLRVLHNVVNNTDLLSNPGIGADDNIIGAIEKAEMAANQSREAADQTLRVTP